jgi:hypothetical protein
VRIRGSLASFDPRFANHVLGLLRQLFEFAQERGIVTDIPTIKPERTRRKISIPIPDEEDLDALLVAADRLTRKGRSAGTDLVLMLFAWLGRGLAPWRGSGLAMVRR